MQFIGEKSTKVKGYIISVILPFPPLPSVHSSLPHTHCRWTATSSYWIPLGFLPQLVATYNSLKAVSKKVGIVGQGAAAVSVVRRRSKLAPNGSAPPQQTLPTLGENNGGAVNCVWLPEQPPGQPSSLDSSAFTTYVF